MQLTRRTFEETNMKTPKPIKKTGKLTSKKIEKKAPLVKFGA
jgi:hypothetical protein